MFISEILRYLQGILDKYILSMASIFLFFLYITHIVEVTFQIDEIHQKELIRLFISCFICFFLNFYDSKIVIKKTQYTVKAQILGAIGSSLYFFGLNYISMNEAAILFSINSILSSSIVNHMKGEHISISRQINLITCVLGIGLVLYPNSNVKDPVMHIVGCISILICSMLQSFFYIRMKQMTYINQHIVLDISFNQNLWRQVNRLGQMTEYWCYIIEFALFTVILQLKQADQVKVKYLQICNYTYIYTLHAILIQCGLFGQYLSSSGSIGGFLILLGLHKQSSEDKNLRMIDYL